MNFWTVRLLIGSWRDVTNLNRVCIPVSQSGRMSHLSILIISNYSLLCFHSQQILSGESYVASLSNGKITNQRVSNTKLFLYWLKKKTCMQYILLTFFLLAQILLDPLLLATHLTSCFFPLSLSQSKQRAKAKQKAHKRHGVCCVLLATPEHRACPGVWLIYPDRLHWRKLTSPFPAGVKCKQVLARVGP